MPHPLWHVLPLANGGIERPCVARGPPLLQSGHESRPEDCSKESRSGLHAKPEVDSDRCRL